MLLLSQFGWSWCCYCRILWPCILKRKHTHSLKIEMQTIIFLSASNKPASHFHAQQHTCIKLCFLSFVPFLFTFFLSLVFIVSFPRNVYKHFDFMFVRFSLAKLYKYTFFFLYTKSIASFILQFCEEINT